MASNYPIDSASDTQEDYGIKDVWNHNLHAEFRNIRLVVQTYHWVAMDTEFPGVVVRPIGEFRSASEYQYHLLKCNVDLLKIIQLGLTFMDENGQTPPGCTTWQFNFKFNLQEDMYAQDSIDLLQNSGLQFRRHEEEGIDPLEFAELIMTSGVVLLDNVKWLSFHSGYDFGYLLKLLTDNELPQDEQEFFDELKLYFPTIYDVKYLMKLCKNLKGGLQEVAEQLELRRVGPQHQAGSDSLLTGMAFFKIKEIFFDDNIESSSGHLYGLGAPANSIAASNAAAAAAAAASAAAAAAAAAATAANATATAAATAAVTASATASATASTAAAASSSTTTFQENGETANTASST